jgi:hypothetical protein
MSNTRFDKAFILPIFLCSRILDMSRLRSALRPSASSVGDASGPKLHRVHKKQQSIPHAPLHWHPKAADAKVFFEEISLQRSRLELLALHNGHVGEVNINEIISKPEPELFGQNALLEKSILSSSTLKSEIRTIFSISERFTDSCCRSQ